MDGKDRRVVMIEEDYVAALQFIIKRDFYPSEDGLIDPYNGIDKRYDLDISLSQFNSKYVSEDNESFSTILSEMKIKHDKKYFWVDGRRANDTVKSIKPNDAEMGGWKYVPKNSLMFTPEAVPMKTKKQTGKSISYENTRFTPSRAISTAYVPIFKQERVYELLPTPKHETTQSSTTRLYSIPQTPVRDEILHSIAKKPVKTPTNSRSPWRNSSSGNPEEFSPAAQRLIRSLKRKRK